MNHSTADMHYGHCMIKLQNRDVWHSGSSTTVVRNVYLC
jgi:hypothetical protein